MRYYNLFVYYVKSLAFYPFIFENDLSFSDFFLSLYLSLEFFFWCISLMNLIKDGFFSQIKFFLLSNRWCFKECTIESKLCASNFAIAFKWKKRYFVAMLLFFFLSLWIIHFTLCIDSLSGAQKRAYCLARLKHFWKYVTKFHWQKAYIFHGAKETDDNGLT